MVDYLTPSNSQLDYDLLEKLNEIPFELTTDILG